MEALRVLTERQIRQLRRHTHLPCRKCGAPTQHNTQCCTDCRTFTCTDCRRTIASRVLFQRTCPPCMRARTKRAAGISI